MLKAKHRRRYKRPSALSMRKRRFHDFLKEYPVGVLSTVTPDGDTHGSVIYFDVGGDFVISFLTRDRTRKHDNLCRNNHVTLTVFDPKSQTTVQIIGEAEEIRDGYTINKVADAVLKASLRTSESGLPPVTKLDGGSFVGYRIFPKQMRMTVYGRPDIDGRRNMFETIEAFDFNENLIA